VAAGACTVEESCAPEQVAAGAGRQELADRADRSGQHLRRRGHRRQRVSDDDHRRGAHEDARAAKKRLEARHDRGDGQDGEAQGGPVGDPVAADDAEPVLDDRGRGAC
jgi:hypothetical protein